MQLFYIVYYKQPEVIWELVKRGLLPVSVLREGQMPPEELPSDIIAKEDLKLQEIERLMRHDFFQRVGGAIKQRGWGR